LFETSNKSHKRDTNKQTKLRRRVVAFTGSSCQVQDDIDEVISCPAAML
jgi:hypothetical protein